MELTQEEEQFILNRRKFQDLSKPVKTGKLRVEICALPDGVYSWEFEETFFDEKDIEKEIKHFSAIFDECVFPAGSEALCFNNEDGVEEWYLKEDRIRDYPLKEAFVKKHIRHIKSVK